MVAARASTVRAVGPEPGERPRVLAVDDEVVILDVLEQGLEFAGFDVTRARSGMAALALAREVLPNLIVLDIGLPDIDGYEVCRRLRDEGDQVPIVYLTARDASGDLLAGFEHGGDDYVVKPFRLDELVARINAVLRRAGATTQEERVLRCGPLVLDEERHRVTSGNDRIELTPTEFRLLRYLLHNQDRVVSKEQILDAVWGPDHLGTGSRVESSVSYLRTKLGDDATLLRTVRGVGYLLTADRS